MDTKTVRVLLVEDDERNRKLLAKVILACWASTEVTMEVLEADTLAEGLRVAELANVTVLDLGLRDSGAKNTIDSIPMFPRPVIVLTGADDPAITADCIAHGADHVINKGSLIGFMTILMDAISKDIVQRAAREVNEAATITP